MHVLHDTIVAVCTSWALAYCLIKFEDWLSENREGNMKMYEASPS